MTKSMFGMAMVIIVMSLIILLLPFFFAHATAPPKSHLFSDEKCGNALPRLWWGTPPSEIRWLKFRDKDPATDIEIYDFKPVLPIKFYDYAEPPTEAQSESFQVWFRNKKLIAVRAEFTGGEFAKMLRIMAGIYEWHHTQFHQDSEGSIAEFVFIKCETEIIALKFKMGNKSRHVITWYYIPLCEDLLKEGHPWTTPK